MKQELELFGFYISENPITLYKKKLPQVIDLENISAYFDKNVLVIGTILKARQVITKNKEEMLFLTISDEVAKVEVVLFPNIYKQVKPLKTNDIVYIKGKVKKRFAQMQIEAIEVKKLNKEIA